MEAQGKSETKFEPFANVTSHKRETKQAVKPIDPSFRFSDEFSEDMCRPVNGQDLDQEDQGSVNANEFTLYDLEAYNRNQLRGQTFGEGEESIWQETNPQIDSQEFVSELFTFNKKESQDTYNQQESQDSPLRGSALSTAQLISLTPMTMNMSGDITRSIRNETIRRHFFTEKDAVIQALNTTIKEDSTQLRENYHAAEDRMRTEITRLKKLLNKAETDLQRVEKSYQSQVKFVNAQCQELQEENESLRNTIRQNQMVVVKLSSNEMNQYKSTEIGQLENQVRNLQGEIELRDGREKMFKCELDMLRKRMESSEQDWQKKLSSQLDEISAKDLENDSLRRKLRFTTQSCEPGIAERAWNSTVGTSSLLRSNFRTRDSPLDIRYIRPQAKQGRSSSMVHSVLTTPRKTSTGLGSKFLTLKMEKARLEGELAAASGSSELRDHLQQELTLLNSVMSKIKQKMNM